MKKKYLIDGIHCCYFHSFILHESYIIGVQHPTILFYENPYCVMNALYSGCLTFPIYGQSVGISADWDKICFTNLMIYENTENHNEMVYDIVKINHILTMRK